MLSVKAAIQMAQSRKEITGNPFSMQNLARQLGMTAPISVHDLMLALDKLPPQSMTFISGRMVASNVHASATLFVQSDGGTAFVGDVHESGVFGDNFLITIMLPDVKDDRGFAIVFTHADTIVGQEEIGFSDKNWSDYGFTASIADNWEQVKMSRAECRMWTNPDPWQVTEAAVLAPLIAAGLVIAGAGIFLATVAPQDRDGNPINCGYEDPNDPGAPLRPGNPGVPPDPESGFQFRCRKDSN